MRCDCDYNDMLLFNRPQWPITPDPVQYCGNSMNLPYGDYGVVPGLAQAIQDYPYTANPTPPSYFTRVQAAIANFVTTRVHLQPIGKADNNG